MLGTAAIQQERGIVGPALLSSGKRPNFSITALRNKHIRHHAGKQAVQVRRHLHQHGIFTRIYRNPGHHVLTLMPNLNRNLTPGLL
jgi:hypothetical protein